MRLARLGIAICVVAASIFLISTPIALPNEHGFLGQKVIGPRRLLDYRVQLIGAVLRNVTGSPDYEDGALSFPYPTQKCSRNPQVDECCPKLHHSLMKNSSISRKVPSKLLIGIGTLKSGTHFLNTLLQQHPKAIPGVRKEFQYFKSHEEYKKGKDGYLELLRVDEATSQDDLDNKLFYEISPSSLKIPWAPCYLKSWFPDAKILVIMRNPTMRALSQLRYKQSRCIEQANNGEIESITECCWVFRSSLELLVSLLMELWKKGCTFNAGEVGKSWKGCLGDLWGQDAMDAGVAGLLIQGLYGPQIAWWMEFFPPSQFIFIKAEDLYKDPISEMNKILDAFDLSPKYGEGGVPLDHSEDQQHKTNWPNVYDPLLDTFMNDIKWFYHRPNKELSLLLEKKGIHQFQFNSSEVTYENGEIPKSDFFRSMHMQCRDIWNWP